MSTILHSNDAEGIVKRRFAEAAIDAWNITMRQYPEETIFVVLVDEEDLVSAADLGNQIDRELDVAGFKGFVTVRRGERSDAPTSARVSGVHDDRATELVRLITSRSRTSEAQPSLAYVRDAAANAAAVSAPRHHLIFGRRGAGKTALMVEVKQTIEEDGNVSVWMNMQTYRHEPIQRIFLYFVQKICQTIAVYYKDRPFTPNAVLRAAELDERVQRVLAGADFTEQEAQRLIPEVQQLVARFVSAADVRLYIFVDDFYYLPRAQQPALLDMFHGCVRDTDAWLKVASIRHLTRWFQSSPPLGLQTGHDAAHIDLDVTLQDPGRATQFLENVLLAYAQHAGVRRLSVLFSRGALDRLVLASGAVPRDYLTLAAGALTRAQARAKARLVGTQDVNQAAGDAAQAKIQELEDDLAADQGSAERTLAALNKLKKFCLEGERSTYFRVDIRDKESRTEEYSALTDLLEVRLTHLIDPSVSDARRAGERAEVFMLDLSQFAGARLKQAIRVLDLDGGRIVSKRTASKEPTKVARSPRELTTIYRAAPLLDLEIFETSSR
jgi:hypothetical protein